MTNKIIKNEDILMLWGFLLFALGALGVIQIGILEGVSELILYALLFLLLGILIILSIIINDRVKSKK